jgi:hypothetical protein
MAVEQSSTSVQERQELSQIIQIDEAKVSNHLNGLVRETVQEGALTPEAQHARSGDFGVVGLPNSVVTAWGLCPQTPEICRFGPGAWFRRRLHGGFSHIRLLRLPC